jgi:hypothetical protein
VRIPDAATLRTWKRASAARVRAEAVAAKARAAEKAAAAAAFEAGTKITLAELLPDLALTAKLILALKALPRSSNAEYELNRLTSSEFSELAIAKRHLAHLTKRDEDTGCSICQRAARDRKEADERKARITALPRNKATCPVHGKRIGYNERVRTARVRLTPDGEQEWVENFPVWYCPIDLAQYYNTALFLAERAKAEAKLKTKGLTFICPNPECGCTVTSIVDNNMVSCDECGAEWDAGAVKPVKPEKAAA